MMKPARRGAKPLAEFTPGLISEALAARGLGEASRSRGSGRERSTGRRACPARNAVEP
jgi:hypothetical protein